MPASVQIPRTSAPEQLPIFSASERRLIPRWSDILREWMRRIETRASGLVEASGSVSVSGSERASERAGVDGKRKKKGCDCCSPGRRELDLAVYPTGTEQGGVENVDSVRRHDDL